MLSDGRERPALGCAVALFLTGVVVLAFVGAWVVTAALWEWVT